MDCPEPEILRNLYGAELASGMLDFREQAFARLSLQALEDPSSIKDFLIHARASEIHAAGLERIKAQTLVLKKQADDGTSVAFTGDEMYADFLTAINNLNNKLGRSYHENANPK